MPSQKYSWENDPQPRRRRAWRWLLLLPLLLILLGAAVGAVVVLSARSEFLILAGQFDLSRLERMESASLIYDRKGDLMGKIFIQNRDPVPYEKLSPWLVKAVVAAEDQRFWEHTGVDYWGIVRAAQANWTAGRIRQGASTVTQQVPSIVPIARAVSTPSGTSKTDLPWYACIGLEASGASMVS